MAPNYHQRPHCRWKSRGNVNRLRCMRAFRSRERCPRKYLVLGRRMFARTSIFYIEAGRGYHWGVQLAFSIICSRCAQGQRRGCSIDVLLVATLSLEVGDEGDSLVGRSRAVRGDQIHQSALYVLAHGYGAADIDVGAVGDPRPQIAADLAHAILDIEFLFAIARPSERKTS